MAVLEISELDELGNDLPPIPPAPKAEPATTTAFVPKRYQNNQNWLKLYECDHAWHITLQAIVGTALSFLHAMLKGHNQASFRALEHRR